MQVTKNTPNLLHLSSVPWFYGSLSILFIVVLLYFAGAAFLAGDAKAAWIYLGLGTVVGGAGFCLFGMRKTSLWKPLITQRLRPIGMAAKILHIGSC